MDKGLKYWFSWIGVLPISLIAGLIVEFPVHWILYGTLSGGDNPFITPYPELPERILAPFFRALVIVWGSALIAPEHKFKTAVILATLWIFGTGASFVLGYLGFHTDSIQLKMTAGGLPIIMGVIGAVFGLYLVKRILSDKESKTTKINRSNTMGMFISISLIAILLGVISGIVWASAISYSISSGLLYGGISGLIVGFIFFLFQKVATSSSNLQNKQILFATGSMMTLIFMISTIIAVVFGLVRWLFF